MNELNELLIVQTTIHRSRFVMTAIDSFIISATPAKQFD